MDDLHARIAALEADAAVMRRKVAAAEGMADVIQRNLEWEFDSDMESTLTAWQEASRG